LGYYEEIYGESADGVHRAAWRHRIEQALRFEAALEGMPTRGEGARILDVGCGPGALWAYLRDTGRSPAAYLGLDQLVEAVAHARGAHAGARFEVASWPAWSAPGEVWEEVVGIGCAVDGAARLGSARVRHVEAQLERMCEVATRGVCLIVLSEEARQARASLALESALLGLTRQEARGLVARLCARHRMYGWVREGLLATDRVLYLRRAEDLRDCGDPSLIWSCDLHDGGDVLCDLHDGGDRTERWTTQRRVLAGPWGEGMSEEERAWYWLEVGSAREASAALGPLREAEGGRRALLRERLEQALCSGAGGEAG
jgi:hypothetical protein